MVVVQLPSWWFSKRWFIRISVVNTMRHKIRKTTTSEKLKNKYQWKTREKQVEEKRRKKTKYFDEIYYRGQEPNIDYSTPDILKPAWLVMLQQFTVVMLHLSFHCFFQSVNFLPSECYFKMGISSLYWETNKDNNSKISDPLEDLSVRCGARSSRMPCNIFTTVLA